MKDEDIAPISVQDFLASKRIDIISLLDGNVPEYLVPNTHELYEQAASWYEEMISYFNITLRVMRDKVKLDPIQFCVRADSSVSISCHFINGPNSDGFSNKGICDFTNALDWLKGLEESKINHPFKIPHPYYSDIENLRYEDIYIPHNWALVEYHCLQGGEKGNGGYIEWDSCDVSGKITTRVFNEGIEVGR